MIVGGNFRKCDWFKSIIYIPTALNGTKYFMDKRSGFETIIHWSFQESVRWCSFHVNKSCWEIWYDIFVYFQVDKLKKILVRCQSLETVYWIYSDRTAWQSLRTIFVISTIYGLHCSILKAFVWKPHKNDIKNCILYSYVLEWREEYCWKNFAFSQFGLPFILHKAKTFLDTGILCHLS